jgi:hypothetical protein
MRNNEIHDLGIMIHPLLVQKYCNVKSKCDEVMIKRYALHFVAIVVLSTICPFG